MVIYTICRKTGKTIDVKAFPHPNDVPEDKATKAFAKYIAETMARHPRTEQEPGNDQIEGHQKNKRIRSKKDPCSTCTYNFDDLAKSDLQPQSEQTEV